jgi:hypothetical protein
LSERVEKRSSSRLLRFACRGMSGEWTRGRQQLGWAGLGWAALYLSLYAQLCLLSASSSVAAVSGLQLGGQWSWLTAVGGRWAVAGGELELEAAAGCR